MKLLFSLLTAAAFSGCATITVDVATKLGRTTLTADGQSVHFGFNK